VQAMRRQLDAASSAAGALPKMHVATLEPALQAETKMRYAIAMLLLSGCANFGGVTSQDLAAMSAAQIRAVAADKTAGADCMILTGAGYSAKWVHANLDEVRMIPGTVVVNPESCGMTITIATPVPAKP